MNTILRLIIRLFRFFVPRKPRRTVKLFLYSEADEMIKKGRRIAPEEDSNGRLGFVYLESTE